MKYIQNTIVSTKANINISETFYIFYISVRTSRISSVPRPPRPTATGPDRAAWAVKEAALATAALPSVTPPGPRQGDSDVTAPL